MTLMFVRWWLAGTTWQGAEDGCRHQCPEVLGAADRPGAVYQPSVRKGHPRPNGTSLRDIGLWVRALAAEACW